MSNIDWENLLESVKKLSIEIGNWAKKSSVSSKEIEEKGKNNLVSFVDKEAEKKFVKGLSELLPDSGFIAEEGTTEKKGDRYNWIIDPIDGTTNYLHDLPFYCTSVALVENENDILLGVIYSPRTEELFYASKGEGAFLNGNKIEVSKNNTLGDSLVATGFPYHSLEKQDLYMDLLTHFTSNSHGIRRMGSAALDIAYVACGRFESFYEAGLYPWDVAAGILLVNEAGGEVSSFQPDKNPIYDGEIIASNGLVHEEVFSCIRDFFLEKPS